MADEGEVSALVCDNGSGMVKVRTAGGWKAKQRRPPKNKNKTSVPSFGVSMFKSGAA
jgi:hypothetical protein